MNSIDITSNSISAADIFVAQPVSDDSIKCRVVIAPPHYEIGLWGIHRCCLVASDSRFPHIRPFIKHAEIEDA